MFNSYYIFLVMLGFTFLVFSLNLYIDLNYNTLEKNLILWLYFLFGLSSVIVGHLIKRGKFFAPP
jgi:hypothetical protein